MNKLSRHTGALMLAFMVMQAVPASAAAPVAAGAPHSQNLSPDTVRAALISRAQTLRAAWRQSHPGQEDTVAPPTITSGNILTPSIDVSLAPAAPKMKINFTSPGGLESAVFEFISPSGQQYSTTSYFNYGSPSLLSGSLKVESPSSFNLYSESGTWTLLYVYITDFAGNYTELTGDQVAGVFATTALQVNNLSPADFTPPSVSSGTILTPKLSASSTDPVFSASVKATDDVSGFQFINILLVSPTGTPLDAFGSLPSPLTSGTVTAYGQLFAYGTAPEIGTWMINSIGLCDVANNCNFITDPGAIATIFGKNTFKVTK